MSYDRFYHKKRGTGGTKAQRGGLRSSYGAHRPGGRRDRSRNSEGKSDRYSDRDLSALIKDREKFPDEVRKASYRVPKELAESVIARELRRGREDLRKLEIVTIDGADTKDVDDAVSIEKRQDGTFVLGVHIADVSHYVKYGTYTDMEAARRGTTVYLPDMVLPMLPRSLSNGICSLNENTDRLALSVEMITDAEGNITDHRIFESIIRVKYKITYEDYYKLFEEKDRVLEEKYRGHMKMLSDMAELAALRKKIRRKRGALDFEFPETKVKVDASGKPVDVYATSPTFAENVIEEFMLAANETVAEHFYWLDVPFIYRNHLPPEAESIDRLSESVRGMGYTLKGRGGEIHTHAIQSMLDKCKGMRNEEIVQILTLRAMQKASYASVNEGHFGLAAEYYTHFTSPIRRYPDLFIHRVIKLVLSGKLGPVIEEELKTKAVEMGESCSDSERLAMNAERLRTDMLVCRYMEGFIGEKLGGNISGMTKFGIFVRLDNSAEGLVFYNSMPDYMIFDERHLVARGETTKRTYAIGDRVNVKIANTNAKTGQIEFIFA